MSRRGGGRRPRAQTRSQAHPIRPLLPCPSSSLRSPCHYQFRAQLRFTSSSPRSGFVWLNSVLLEQRGSFGRKGRLLAASWCSCCRCSIEMWPLCFAGAGCALWPASLSRSPALLFLLLRRGGDGGGGGEVPAGDSGGAQPLGGVLRLHRHLQQGSHELPRLQLRYEIQSCPRCLAPFRPATVWLLDASAPCFYSYAICWGARSRLVQAGSGSSWNWWLLHKCAAALCCELVWGDWCCERFHSCRGKRWLACASSGISVDRRFGVVIWKNEWTVSSYDRGKVIYWNWLCLGKGARFSLSDTRMVSVIFSSKTRRFFAIDYTWICFNCLIYFWNPIALINMDILCFVSSRVVKW